MSMVMELQQAIYSNEEVSNLLIKAYMIARKLGITNIIEWLDFEMNGYPTSNNLPSYRVIPTFYKAFRQDKVWVMAEFAEKTISSMEQSSEQSIYSLYMTLSIKEIEITLMNEYREWQDPRTQNLFGLQGGCKLKVSQDISPPALIKILNQVKNKLLDWALELESQGILGENMTFTKEEKENASNITINNYGHNSNIQAGGNNNTIESSNTFTVKNKEDLTNQFHKLTELLIEHKEHSNYKNVIDDISYIKNQLSRENIEKSTISNLWNTLSPAIELLVGGALSGAISGVTAGITQNLLF